LQLLWSETFRGANETPAFSAGAIHNSIATSPDSTVIISMLVTVSPRVAKQISRRDFKPTKQVFVIWAKNQEPWQCVHKNEPPSVKLRLLEPQWVSAKFCHDIPTHRGLHIVLEFSASLTPPLWLNVANTRTSARHVVALW
jgi:hypothetical protein